MRFYTILLLGVLFLSCTEDSKLESEIAKINADFVVERFDKALLEADESDFVPLRDAYPFLFSKQIPDSVWIKRITDTLQKELLNEVNSIYKDFKQPKQDLKELFQHIKYYDKKFNVPRVITLTNDVDYRNKTVVTDSLILIALDNFLGEDHRFYQNIPRYIAANMSKNHIVPNVADQLAKQYVFQKNRKTLLDEMIYFGKLHYFKDVMAPFLSDADKIGYTQNQLEWAKVNEEPIWSYFVEKELLFSTDSKLPGRFIADAPFSKFYLQLDNESPGRLGQYIGWQIVRAFASNSDKDAFEIMRTEPEEIFKKSKFKPRK